MASWSDFDAAAPELAERVHERLDAHKHKTIATLRRDGSPRISGTETAFARRRAVDRLDVAGAARRATCSATRASRCTAAPTTRRTWPGDAKLAGVVDEIIDAERVREINGEAGADGPSHLFRLDLREVSTVGLDEARTLW